MESMDMRITKLGDGIYSGTILSKENPLFDGSKTNPETSQVKPISRKFKTKSKRTANKT